MRDDFGNFRSRHPVGFCRLQMVFQRAVGDALADERGDGHHAAVSQGKPVIAAPHFPKEYVVVETGKFWGEIAKLVAPRCLFDFLLCHDIRCQH